MFLFSCMHQYCVLLGNPSIVYSINMKLVGSLTTAFIISVCFISERGLSRLCSHCILWEISRLQKSFTYIFFPNFSFVCLIDMICTFANAI